MRGGTGLLRPLGMSLCCRRDLDRAHTSAAGSRRSPIHAALRRISWMPPRATAFQPPDPEAANVALEAGVEPTEGRAQEPQSAVPGSPAQHPMAGGGPLERATLMVWRAHIEAWATGGFHPKNLQEHKMHACDPAPIAPSGVH